MEQEKTVSVAALMTLPRYINAYAKQRIESALREVGIPLTESQGVFYGQCMQRMLEHFVDRGGCDYAVTIDHDSLFTGPQLRRLIRWKIERDDIDAITAIQVRRSRPVMLGTVVGGETIGEDLKQIVWDGKPIKASTAHFGLTVIDLAKLRTVPKPWFCSTPNAEGMWEGDKVDDDVHFWLQWKKAGHSIYIDPGVRIGHLEEMVAIHDEQMNPHHIYPADWEREYAN